VLNGKGASLLDGYMEDLATDRIYRLMIAQRAEQVRKRGLPPLPVTQMFDEELDRILSELPAPWTTQSSRTIALPATSVNS